MNTKQRDVVFQRWSGVIERGAVDLASLNEIRKNALSDSDVHDDPTLQSMIRSELQKRRAELERKLKSEVSATTQPEAPPQSESESLEPVPSTTLEEDRDSFDRLAQTLCTSLEDGDKDSAVEIIENMRALQQRWPEAIPTEPVRHFEQQIERLRVRIQQLADEIKSLKLHAVSASRNGSEPDLARSMRRLTAIHAAHPLLLDEFGLENVRRAVAAAADERREHQVTTQRLLDRERAITSEIIALAAAVRGFHKVACAAPDASEAFSKAEATYLRAIQKVRTYDTEWFAGVVLDLAGLLAEWTVPPPGAEGRIDRFLDAVSRGLSKIRAEMRQIDREQDANDKNRKNPAEP